MIEVGDMVRLIERTQEVDPPVGTTGIGVESHTWNVLVQWERGTAGRNCLGYVGIGNIEGRWWVTSECLEVVE